MLRFPVLSLGLLLLSAAAFSQTTPVTITTASPLGPFVAGQKVSVQMAATGGAAPYTFAISSGRLPLGLVLGTDGNLNGAPITAGTSTFSVTATDSLGKASTPKSFSVTVADTIVLNTNQLQFSTTAGGLLPPPSQQVSIGSTSLTNALKFTATASVGSPAGGNWLVIAPPSGATPTALVVSINQTGLAAGLYFGAITITSPNIAAPQTVAVSLTVLAAPGPTVFPAALAFKYQLGDATLPAPQTVIVTLPGTPFNIFANVPYSAAVTGSQAFTLTHPTGTVPAFINVSVPQTGGTAGTFTGNLVITFTGTTPSTISVPLTLTVTPAAAPVLTTSSTLLNLAAVQTGAAVSSQFQITNTGGGAPTAQAAAATTSGGNWLTAKVITGAVTHTTPGIVTVTASPGALAPGTYRGSILISGAGATGPPPVAVTLVVSAANQAIVLTPQALTFSGSAAVPIPVQSVTVVNSGKGTMNWTATASTLSGGNWLRVNTASGSSAAGLPQAASVSVNVAGLAPGTYSGTVRITSPTATNSPQSASVTLTVRAAAAAPPEPSLSDFGAILSAATGAATSGTTTIQVQNFGGPNLGFGAIPSTSDSANWLNVTPATGTVTGGGSTPVVISANTTALAAGLRQGAVRFLFADGTIRTLGVSLTIADGGASCAATGLVAQITSIEDGFDLNSGDPVELRAKVTDNCGAPVDTGSVLAVFSNGDAPAALTDIGGGIWSATWQPVTTADSMTISLTAAAGSLTGQTVLPGSVLFPSAPNPIAQAIANSASYSNPGQVTPGLNVAIFGLRLADELAIGQDVPLPQAIDDVAVTLNGVALPLFFVSPNQINAIIPNGIAVNTQQQLVVSSGTVYSAPIPVTVTDSAPAIYTLNQQGSGQGAILIANSGGIIAAPAGSVGASRPARRGEYIEIFCTGLGAVDNAPSDGDRAPSAEPLARTRATPTVTIGGQAVPVLYSGLAPGLISICQIDVEIPDNATPGDAVPVVVSVNGQSSNTATVAVSQ